MFEFFFFSKSLSAKSLNDFNSEFVGVKLPKAEDKNEAITAYVIGLIKQNPSIRQLSVNNCNLNILKVASDILHQLNFLEIIKFTTNFVNSAEPIHFEMVRYITMSSTDERELLANIVFDRLEWFNLFVKYPFTEKCMEFIDKRIGNTNLTTITLYAKEMSNERFLMLPEMLPNLQTVNIHCGSTFIADDILNFIKKSEHLNDLTLNLEMLESEKRRLYENIEASWMNKYVSAILNTISLTK